LLWPPSIDSNALVIDARANKVVRTLGHPRSVIAAAFSHDGSLLATATGAPENTVRVWRVSARDQVPLIHAEQAPIKATAFSPTQRRLAIVTSEIATIIDPTTGTIQQFLGVGADTIAYSPDGQPLIIGADNAAVVFTQLL
jgi:WD40 repeat protein